MAVVTRRSQETNLGQSPAAFLQTRKTRLTFGQGQLPGECSLQTFERDRAGGVQHQQAGTHHVEDMVLRITPVVNESQSPQGMDDETSLLFLAVLR